MDLTDETWHGVPIGQFTIRDLGFQALSVRSKHEMSDFSPQNRNKCVHICVPIPLTFVLRWFYLAPLTIRWRRAGGEVSWRFINLHKLHTLHLCICSIFRSLRVKFQNRRAEIEEICEPIDTDIVTMPPFVPFPLKSVSSNDNCDFEDSAAHFALSVKASFMSAVGFMLAQYPGIFSAKPPPAAETRHVYCANRPANCSYHSPLHRMAVVPAIIGVYG